MADSERCEICKYSRMAAGVLYCLRYPPQLVSEDFNDGTIPRERWPKVAVTDWCGEYRRRRRASDGPATSREGENG